MAQATASLDLAYAFVSSPNPIRASVHGANPNTIDILVIVSNPSMYVVTMREIAIQIPTGDDISADISTSPNLPSPVYDTTIPWLITTTGEYVRIRPTPGFSGNVIAPIQFTLPGIQVNEQVGTVPIAVTELPASGPKVVDSRSYSLLKRPANFPVRSFSADPAVLTNLHQSVTLHWDCTTQGQASLYGLRAEISATMAEQNGESASSDARVTQAALATRLKDCIDDGDCYTCANGASGVTYGPVNQTTTFELDIVKVKRGAREIVGTLRTTVKLQVPSISGNSYLQQSVSGRLVWLHWLAFNSAYCTVELDGKQIVERAPVDTYERGFLVFAPNTPGSHQFTVVAHAESGSAQASHVFPPVTISGSVTVDTGNDVGPLAITPDGSLALVTGAGGRIRLLDIKARQFNPHSIPVYNPRIYGANPVAISPDGTLGLVAQPGDNNVAVIWMPTCEVESGTISLAAPRSVAFTPDGSLMLVGLDGNDETLAVIDVASRTVEPTRIAVGAYPGVIAITPDGSLALVGSGYFDDNNVRVVDIPARKAEETAINVAPGPHNIAITGDGSLALVADQDGVVRVIDIAARKVEPEPLPTGGPILPSSLVTTPDARWAFAVVDSSKEICLIDVSARTCMPFGRLPEGYSYHGAQVWGAISANGTALVILNDGYAPSTIF